MKNAIWFFLALILVSRIILYYQNLPNYTDGTRLRITGQVTSEPIRYKSSQYFVHQGFKIYLPIYPEINYGDFIVVEGKLSEGLLEKAKLIEKKEAVGVLYKLRRNLIGFYFKGIPQPHSSLIAGVTIGSKAGIPQEFWEGLKSTGTAHVVVASGMNVTLVSQFLISLLVIFFRRRKAIILAMIGIWSYAILSGFDAPIIRASIMGSLVFSAQEIGRLNFSFRTLLITAFLMLFMKPEWLSDVGFQLSLVATTSLILLEPKVDMLLKKIPELIRKDLSTSLAAQIGVAPILYFTFGQFNPLSPLINVLILWTIVPITIIGMLSGILGLIYQPIGTLVLWLVYPLTSWFIFIVNSFS